MQTKCNQHHYSRNTRLKYSGEIIRKIWENTKIVKDHQIDEGDVRAAGDDNDADGIQMIFPVAKTRPCLLLTHVDIYGRGEERTNENVKYKI